MNIGIDLDDVVYNTGVEVEKEIDAANNPVIREHKVELMRGVLEELPEVVVQFLRDSILTYLANAKPMDNAIEVLKKLREDGHKIILITARDDNLSEGVIELSYQSFKKYGIEEGIVYDKVVFKGVDKASVCISEKVDLFIDDSPKNCEIIRGLGIDVIAFKSRITSEAIDKTDLPSASNWIELYEKISNMK